MPAVRRPLCAIYARQSVKTESDLTSCEGQYEARRSRHPRATGSSMNVRPRRPALQRLLSLFDQDGVDRVVVQRLDRLSRNLRHFVNRFQESRDNHVALTVIAAPELGLAAGGWSRSVRLYSRSSNKAARRDCGSEEYACDHRVAGECHAMAHAEQQPLDRTPDSIHALQLRVPWARPRRLWISR